jgi:hypothetical protein
LHPYVAVSKLLNWSQSNSLQSTILKCAVFILV